MRKSTILAVTLVALLAPAAASAQFTFGARLSYAIAGGDEVKDVKLSDSISAMIPVQLEAGYNVTPDLNIGAFFSYGWASESSDVSDACDLIGADCGITGWRFGVQGIYSLSTVSPTWVPWFGLGVGYESLTLKIEGGGESATFTESGWEFANLQAGADYKAGNMRIGPFLSYSFGQFGSYDAEGGGQSESGDITDKGTHTYFTIGVRGTFGM
jgi:hypothetical protein